MNQLKRIKPLATVVTQTAHQIPSTPIPIRTNRIASGSMNNTGKGAAIGGGSGAALGAILGGVIGKGKGAAIGAAIGTAVGAGTGALIGKKMDKAAAEAKQIEGAQVEQITDNNGLQAVKVTFDSDFSAGFVRQCCFSSPGCQCIRR